MPVIKPTRATAPVFPPESNYCIAKYMDLTKYISMLQRNCLFFCRLDKLDDKHEGLTPQTNYKLREQWYRSGNSEMDEPLSDEGIYNKVNELYEFEKNIRNLLCINCWNKNISESAALWKIYSSFDKGIMIKSSIENLKNSFSNTLEDLQLTEVRYKNYRQEMIPDGNTYYPVLYKQDAYYYEEEVRLIHERRTEFGWEWDWGKEEAEEGFYIKSNLNILIDEIILAPYSPKWFLRLIQDVSLKYNLNKPIKMSELSFH
jgi:hypothetical protein